MLLIKLLRSDSKFLKEIKQNKKIKLMMKKFIII